MLRSVPVLVLMTLLPAAAPAQERIAPKVLVITMFGNEAKPWLEGEGLDRRIEVPGLAPDYPAVQCRDEDLCLATTGMGYANAASSVTALVQSGRFDLGRSYILITGIAGVDPTDGTLGSAHWARYVVDGGLRHHIDPRQIPQGWPGGALALGAKAPGEAPGWTAGTETYRLNEDLVQQALALTRQTELADSDEAEAYRRAYPAPGNAGPSVSICDTVSGDTYWHGSLMALDMSRWVDRATEGNGNYCTTQMEDNASLTALRRGADAGLLDFDRIAVLRTGSNFDREAPGQTASQSLTATSGGFGPATTNAYRVGRTLAHAIVQHWGDWQGGVPKP